MTRYIVQRVKGLCLAGSTLVIFGFGGSCLPDNLWADVLGYSIIQGTAEAIRNTLLVAANLQTP